MGWFGLGDNSDFRIHIFEGKPGLWHWTIKDETGRIRAIPPVQGERHGFHDYDQAKDDARSFVEGLGADFKDLEEE